MSVGQGVEGNDRRISGEALLSNGQGIEGHDRRISGEALLSTCQGVRLRERERLFCDVYDGDTSGGVSR